MHRDDDQELVSRCKNGDKTAFAELVLRYQRPIYNASVSVLRRTEDANDVVQIVFLKVWEKLDEYDSQYKLFSWIYRIALNESLNLLRRNGREEPLEDETNIADNESANPEWQADEAQTSKKIQSTLMKMSTNDRIVLTLRHFSDFSYQEIANILDIDEKTVKSRLFSARQRLCDTLKELRVH